MNRYPMCLCLALAAGGLGRQARAACGDAIDPSRSLVVTSLDVVDNERSRGDGPWSFATVFKRAVANDPAAGAQAYDWLHQYATTKTYNGFPLPERSAGPLFAVWPMAIAAPGEPLALDLRRHPFLLLGIVFRPDLRVDGHFGEGRLVYAVADPVRGPQDMTVALEFALRPTPNLPTRSAWYRSIAKLSQLGPGDAYNRALQRLTDEFTYPYAQTSQLKQLRTNDQYFGQGWDLREFRYVRRERRLLPQAVAKTPDASLNTQGPSALVQWLVANRAQVLTGQYALPHVFSSASAMLLDDRFAWFEGNPVMDPELREAFAVGTCNGCHGRATQTSFLHLSPRAVAAESRKSAHLEAQLTERAKDLEEALCMP